MATAALAATAAPLVPMVSQGAMAQLESLRKYTAEVMTRETTSFDYEKVFIQTIYGEAIFFVFKFAFHMYVAAKYSAFVASHPLEGLSSWVSGIPFFGSIMDKIDDLWDEGVVTDEEWHQMWLDEMDKDPVTKYGNFVFSRYWFFVALGIPAIFALMEKRRVDRMKRKAKLMMKVFKQ